MYTFPHIIIDDIDSAKDKCDALRNVLPAVYNVSRLTEQPIPNLNPTNQSDDAEAEDQKFEMPTVILDEDDANAFEFIFTDNDNGIDALDTAHGIEPKEVETDPLTDNNENIVKINATKSLDSNLNTSNDINQASTVVAPGGQSFIFGEGNDDFHDDTSNDNVGEPSSLSNDINQVSTELAPGG